MENNTKNAFLDFCVASRSLQALAPLPPTKKLAEVIKSVLPPNTYTKGPGDGFVAHRAVSYFKRVTPKMIKIVIESRRGSPFDLQKFSSDLRRTASGERSFIRRSKRRPRKCEPIDNLRGGDSAFGEHCSRYFEAKERASVARISRKKNRKALLEKVANVKDAVESYLKSNALFRQKVTMKEGDNKRTWVIKRKVQRVWNKPTPASLEKIISARFTGKTWSALEKFLEHELQQRSDIDVLRIYKGPLIPA